jgi:hypothetical protein
MILRRVAQAMRDQNWTTILIEFVLLVLGVFLGIQAANWNEARRDQAMEAEYLVRLTRDFRAIEARLDNNVSRWEQKRSANIRVLDDLQAFRTGGAWPRPKAQILLDLEDMQDYRIPAPRAAAYTELLATGKLGLLRDSRLRDALLDYDTQVGFTQAAFDILVRRVEPHRATLVAHLELNRDNEWMDAAAAAADGTIVWSDVDLDRLAADPEVKTTLNLHANASGNQWLVARLQQEKCRAVLALLEPGRAAAEGTKP